MNATFAQPWTIYGDGEILEVNGQLKTYATIRQEAYENIVDETLFISRASEGAVSADWLMMQPIFIRKKYSKAFVKELQERQANLEKNAANRKQPRIGMG